MSDVPTHIHLTYQNPDMTSRITVTWQTVYSDSGNTVKYGVNSGIYSNAVDGVTPHTYTPTAGTAGYIHDAELTGLSPDTAYYFVCGGDVSGWSNERKFRTAPANPSSVRFMAGCDCRTNIADRNTMMNAMAQFESSFFLLGGDIVVYGTDQNLWDDFFTEYEARMVTPSGFTVPIVPALGNHEGYDGWTNGNFGVYLAQFALANNEEWYSLNWGNLLHIIVLNTETALTGAQQAWLQADLEAHKNYLWKIALFHQPPYSSDGHGSNLGVRSAWCPLFDQYHVQIVVAGHDHDYERSLPIYAETVTSSFSNATMYVVAGSFGAPLSAVGANWWTAYSESTYNFCVIDAYSNGTLSYDARNYGGTINYGGEAFQITTPTQADVVLPLHDSLVSLTKWTQINGSWSVI